MTPEPGYPWYRLHWLSWIVVGLQVWALLDLQLQNQLDGVSGSMGWASSSNRGWPMQVVEIIESGSIFSAIPTSLETNWNFAGVAINLIACVLLVVSTLFVLEQWLRSAALFQFSLRDLLALMSVVAVLVALLQQPFPFYSPLQFFGATVAQEFLGVAWRDFQAPLCYPVVLGIGCAIYSAGWLVLAAIQFALAGSFPGKVEES